MRRIADSGMAMTVCPLSNKRLQVVPDLKNHPLRRMLQAGICATVNSDDPSYFGGYVNDNYLAIADALNLTQAEIVQLGRNSFIGSFMTETDKRAAVAHFDDFVDKAR